MDAEEIKREYGLVRDPGETTMKSVQVLEKNEYNPKSQKTKRNRKNSGKLRYQYTILQDPVDKDLDQEDLDETDFNGITQFFTDQYILVRLNKDVDKWAVYQGQSQLASDDKSKPRKICAATTLAKFFNGQFETIDEKDPAKKQFIYYGIPGCGKSYSIDKLIDDELKRKNVLDLNYHKVRCVFHPEYSNADFVGQVFPCVDEKGNVEYSFRPGPLTEIIRRAYLKLDEPFYLIIEEINRGNAAAIFGEAFQLLDRIKSDKDADNSTGNVYCKGWSSYGVDNIDVNAFVRRKDLYERDEIDSRVNEIKYDKYDDPKIKYFRNMNLQDENGKTISFSPNTSIRLPPNLFIFATMNTSDQNVFLLDNAFQRRFELKMVSEKLSDPLQFNIMIGDTGVCWGDFRDWINRKILSTPGIANAEDKRLGGWFITSEAELMNGNDICKYRPVSREAFAEKVLKYLWDDVFKRRDIDSIFKREEIPSLSKLIEKFKSGDGTQAFQNVFQLNKESLDDAIFFRNVDGQPH